jgi:hypothetical protein
MCGVAGELGSRGWDWKLYFFVGMGAADLKSKELEMGSTKWYKRCIMMSEINRSVSL